MAMVVYNQLFYYSKTAIKGVRHADSGHKSIVDGARRKSPLVSCRLEWTARQAVRKGINKQEENVWIFTMWTGGACRRRPPFLRRRRAASVQFLPLKIGVNNCMSIY